MSPDKPANSQLRLRVFAGPNGSGKSTVIKSIRETEASGRLIDVGVYINADDIARALLENSFTFAVYELAPTADSFFNFSAASGLTGPQFPLDELKAAVLFDGQTVRLLKRESLDRVAQLLARFMRELLLDARRRFSFETVFSHDSNIEFMERAAAAGYKVYLYFVSTESAEINKYRVALRKKQGGHDVPVDKIESRYGQSLSLLYPAAQIAYQAFFFDNSVNESPFRLIGHFKQSDSGKQWDAISEADQRRWFEKYYVNIARDLGDSVPEVAE